MLDASKKQVRLKIYSLKTRIDSLNQILRNKQKVKKTRNINILTRITDRKIPYVYSCLSNKKKFEDVVRIIFYVTPIIENILRFSL